MRLELGVEERALQLVEPSYRLIDQLDMATVARLPSVACCRSGRRYKGV